MLRAFIALIGAFALVAPGAARAADAQLVAPIKQFIDITIANLVPDTEEVKAEIEKSLRDMLFVKAAPGQTIFAAWVSYAIMNAPSIESFKLVTDADYVMPSAGHMAVLGTIYYP